MDFSEKTLSEKSIYKGKIIDVHVDEIELPDGKKSIREVVEHNGGVCVAALTKDNKLKFVRQYRYPYGKVLLELPAGKLEKGEEPMQAGIRELEEECALKAETLIPMGKIYPTVAYCSEIIYLYLATDFVVTKQNLDEGEFLSTEEISLDDAVEMVMSSQICDSKTVALVLKTAMYLKEKSGEQNG